MCAEVSSALTHGPFVQGGCQHAGDGLEPEPDPCPTSPLACALVHAQAAAPFTPWGPVAMPQAVLHTSESR